MKVEIFNESTPVEKVCRIKLMMINNIPSLVEVDERGERITSGTLLQIYTDKIVASYGYMGSYPKDSNNCVYIKRQRD